MLSTGPRPLWQARKSARSFGTSQRRELWSTCEKTRLLFGVPAEKSMTWKVLRSGRATSMASAGDHLGKIPEFGDWRSKSVLSYIDESQVDADRVLPDSIEGRG